MSCTTARAASGASGPSVEVLALLARAAMSAAPPRPARREQHGSGAERQAAQQVLEPFAARLVGPLKVVEREQERPVAGDVFEHRAQRPVVPKRSPGDRAASSGDAPSPTTSAASANGTSRSWTTARARRTTIRCASPRAAAP
jgi:hypothetical protein